MLPDISNIEINIDNETETSYQNKRSFLFDFSQGDFVIKDGRIVKTEDLIAIKVWIEKVLKTEKFRFEIYKDVDYGISLEDLIGQNLPRSFVESELRREIKEAIERHPGISEVTNITTEQDGSRLLIRFKVNLEEDISFEQEVTI